MLESLRRGVEALTPKPTEQFLGSVTDEKTTDDRPQQQAPNHHLGSSDLVEGQGRGP
jgi:hypothetical protein